MVEQPSPGFDEGVASIFADYGTSLRGYIRYKLTQQNLEPYVKKKHLQVLDIGGGNGPDAAWLARAGHQVTLIEPSQDQLDYAERRFNFFLSEAARNRIKVVHTTLDEFEREARYDLVLVHGVAMYVPDAEQFIAQAVECIKPSGLLSLLEKGYWGAEARLARKLDFESLTSLQKTRRYTNNLHQEVRAFLPAELEKAITQDRRMQILEWSGIRVVSDENQSEVSALQQKMIDQVISLEHEQGHNPAIRGQAQMLHFIARKDPK